LEHLVGPPMFMVSLNTMCSLYVWLVCHLKCIPKRDRQKFIENPSKSCLARKVHKKKEKNENISRWTHLLSYILRRKLTEKNGKEQFDYHKATSEIAPGTLVHVQMFSTIIFNLNDHFSHFHDTFWWILMKNLWRFCLNAIKVNKM
jgi:hypothetical protein